jgi:general secretion pathway protein J
MADASAFIPAPRAAGREAGFTLLEVMVVLVVLGFLMVGMSKGVTLGIQAVDRQSKALEQRADLDAIDRSLRDLLIHIDPGTGRNPVHFEGDAHEAKFASRLPRAVALDTRRANMTLLVDDDKRLILRWSLIRHETPLVDPPAPKDTVLLDHVDKVEFSYWGPDDGSGMPAGWRDDWKSPYLPFIIRIRLTFPEGDKRHWPAILAAPILEAPGG